MENENKNASSPSENGKKHNGKKKHHKPKGYFMTPNDGKGENTRDSSTAPKGEPQKQKPSNSEGSPKQSGQQGRPASEAKKAEPGTTNQKNHPSSNHHGGKNRKKHKRPANDKPKEPQGTQTTVASDTSPAPVEDIFAPSPKSADRLDRGTPKKMSKFSESAEYAKYADYEEFTYEELYGDKEAPAEEVSSAEEEQPTPKAPEDTQKSVFAEPVVEVVGIKFKDTGKVYYFAPDGIKLRVGNHAIVKTARGLEYGDVALANTFVKESETVPPLRTVVRIATDIDIKHHEENKQKEEEAFRICNEKIIAHGLDMKLIDTQYTFDNSKLLFYFTSSGRVDFRDLVKDLASVFRTRIELRQVGIRDEAKMVGGFGPCGRALCCSLFLTDFGQVSIKMAKEQSLSLNSAKISGICGRLMCCLRYEHEAYEYEIKHTPPVDTVVRTVDGVGVVTEIMPMTASIKVRLSASPEVPPKTYKRNEVTILKKKQ